MAGPSPHRLRRVAGEAGGATGHPVQPASRGETEAQRSTWVDHNGMANRLCFLPWPLRGCGLTRSLVRAQHGSQPASWSQTGSGPWVESRSGRPQPLSLTARPPSAGLWARHTRHTDCITHTPGVTVRPTGLRLLNPPSQGRPRSTGVSPRGCAGKSRELVGPLSRSLWQPRRQPFLDVKKNKRKKNFGRNPLEL